MNKTFRLVLFLLVLLPGVSNLTNLANAGIVGEKAPGWQISEWFNADGGNIDDYRGKVVVIDFFQLWCPGCNSFSIPLMNEWEQKYAREIAAGEISFISIHTVFEGHDYQTPDRLRHFIKEKGITHPVGNDIHAGDYHVPLTMLNYRTRGTPEIAIIDQQGFVQFQDNIFEPSDGENLIDQLWAQ